MSQPEVIQIRNVNFTHFLLAFADAVRNGYVEDPKTIRLVGGQHFVTLKKGVVAVDEEDEQETIEKEVEVASPVGTTVKVGTAKTTRAKK